MPRLHPFSSIIVVVVALALLRYSGASAAEGGGIRESVEVGDHSLQVLRGGNGGPTVVFEGGMGTRLGAFQKIAANRPYTCLAERTVLAYPEIRRSE